MGSDLDPRGLDLPIQMQISPCNIFESDASKIFVSRNSILSLIETYLSITHHYVYVDQNQYASIIRNLGNKTAEISPTSPCQKITNLELIFCIL